VGLATIVAAGPLAARAGGGPENLFLVVNPTSSDSIAVANAFVAARGIPPINVFMLPWAGSKENTTLGRFRDEILTPILKGIDSRRLAPQIDCIVYSSDFPWRIDYAEALPPELAQKDTFPSGSLTGMTMLFGAVASGTPAWLDSESNDYYRRPGPDGVPPESVGFRSWYGWGEDGRLLEAGGSRYLLAVMLGVTAGRGNTVRELATSLERAASADGTKPRGTVYLMTNGDVRTTTRSGPFPAIVKALAALGVKAEIASGALPQRKRDVAGLMTGTPSFDWAASGSTILPGAICENLTSFGGIFTPSAGQTPLSDFLRAGAAGSSGTVVEPYSIQAKFPHPSIHVHYCRGASLMEAFYQSVSAPYQLLVVGDPLCQPWAEIPEVEAVLVGTEGPLGPGAVLSGSVELEPRGGEGERRRRRTVQFRRGPLRPGPVDHLARGHGEDREVIVAAVRADHVPPVGRDGERRSMPTGEHLAGLPGGEIDHAHRTLRRHVGHRVDAHGRAPAGRAGQIARSGPPAAAVAHEGLAPGQHHVVRGHAHLDAPHHLARRQLDLVKLVREIAADVEPRAVRGDGQPGGDLGGPLGRLGRRQRDRVRGRHHAVGDAEHLHGAVHVAHEQPRAVGGEAKPRITLDRPGVGLEVAVGVGGRRRGQVFRRGLHPLADLARGRIDHDHLARLARGDEDPAVGRERHRLRPHPRQVDLPAQRRDELAHGRHHPPAGLAADGLSVAGDRQRRDPAGEGHRRRGSHGNLTPRPFSSEAANTRYSGDTPSLPSMWSWMWVSSSNWVISRRLRLLSQVATSSCTVTSSRVTSSRIAARCRTRITSIAMLSGVLTVPVPLQVGQSWKMLFRSEGRIRCRVISTRPKGLVRRIFVRARSRFIASWSDFSTLRRYFSFRMSMKSLTITPPRSRSRSCRAISLAAIRFIW